MGMHLLDGVMYKIYPIPHIHPELPEWQKVQIFEWLESFGWDEILRPLRKREILDFISEQNNGGQ